MLSNENAIAYRSSRDSPVARRISGILTGTVEWIDANFASDTTYRRNRCRARTVSARTLGEALFRRDIEITVHGAYQACDSRYHAKNLGLASFSIEDNAFWNSITIQSTIGTEPDDTVCATTLLRRELYARDELGLEIASDTQFSRTFGDPEELDSHINTLRNLAVGKVTMREAARSLIDEAGSIPPAYLDFLTDVPYK